MSNECPIPPSEGVREAVRQAFDIGHLYPYSGKDLQAALARYNAVPPESIVLGNGSTEVLDVLVRLLVGPGDETDHRLPHVCVLREPDPHQRRRPKAGAR